MSTVRIENQGPLAVLRLDKPRGNAIDPALVEDLIEACAALESDRQIRGVLLASAHPKIFCPGLDLVGLLELDRPSMQRFMSRFARSVWGLYTLTKPLVAALSGHAVAGGCVYALTADHRVLRRGGVNIGLNEIRVGVPLPWSVALLLQASVGPARVGDVALLGKNFTDEEALAVGLAHELAPEDGFEQTCLARLEEYAEKDSAAFATTKAYLRASVIEQMKSREETLAPEWLDSWFSESTRSKIKSIVESLGKGRG